MSVSESLGSRRTGLVSWGLVDGSAGGDGRQEAGGDARARVGEVALHRVGLRGSR